MTPADPLAELRTTLHRAADLASALAAHHEGDLAELADDEERRAAVAALVEGYRHGG